MVDVDEDDDDDDGDIEEVGVPPVGGADLEDDDDDENDDDDEVGLAYLEKDDISVGLNFIFVACFYN